MLPSPSLASASPSAAAATRKSKTRLEAVDAMRGTVMLLVFLSHFADAYLRPLSGHAEQLRQKLTLLTMLATPSFMCLSGLMLGLLHVQRGHRFGSIQEKLQRRGLFLLTAGHLVMVPTYLCWVNEVSDLMRVFLVTDTIGMALLVGPTLVAHLGNRARIALGLALFAAGWVVSLTWWPSSAGWQFTKELFFGQQQPTLLLSSFPMVQWMGVYLASSALGAWLKDPWAPGANPGRQFLRAGFWLGVVCAVLMATHEWLRNGGTSLPPVVRSMLYLLSSVGQKAPPSPAYVIFYGGLAITGLGVLLSAELTGRLLPYLRWASVVGRHSLFAFVLQFYVYYAAIYSLRLPYVAWWPLLFAGTVALIWGMLWAWDKRESAVQAPVTVPTRVAVRSSGRR